MMNLQCVPNNPTRMKRWIQKGQNNKGLQIQGKNKCLPRTI